MDGDFRPTDARPELPPQGRLSPLAAATPFGDVPAFDVRGLMGSGTVAHMVLDGQTYCLRITRSGKLILTK